MAHKDKSDCNSSSILDNYTGNKQVNGLWQFIINRIPPYKVYYELFAGSAAIARNLPAMDHKVIVDCNRSVTDALRCMPRLKNANVICADILQFLPSVIDRTASGVTDIFVYMDPPYLFSTRYGKRRLYKYEMTDMHHRQLLLYCSKVKFNCMISHPECELYDKHLKGWTKEKFKVSYHGKQTWETIYYNYPRPHMLQTYMYVGSNCWDRQRIKRKIERLANKLLQLPELERNAVIARVMKRTY